MANPTGAETAPSQPGDGGNRPAISSPGFLARVLDLGHRPGDDPDLRTRKRTAVAAVLVIVLAGSAYLAVGIAIDRPIVTILSVVQEVLQLAALAIFARTGRLQPMIVVTIVVGFLVVASGLVTLGGIENANGGLVYAALVPMGAVLFLGRRAAVPTFVAFAALVLWAALTDSLWRVQASPVPPDMGVALYSLNLIISSAIGLGLVLFIDGERIRAKARSESLLLNVLPRAVVERLDAGERVIADQCPEVTVLFTDVVAFTPFAERQAPQRVVEVLNRLFSAFDDLTERYRLEKIKTIGDAYMVVAGVPAERQDHVEVMVEMALAMHDVASLQPEIEGHRIQLRTGIATGPVVAGVIGRQKFSYDLWGDTVNTASRMESSGIPDRIQVTAATWEHVRERYPWEVRQSVEIKGKGPMRTYLLDPALVSERPAPAPRDSPAGAAAGVARPKANIPRSPR